MKICQQTILTCWRVQTVPAEYNQGIEISQARHLTSKSSRSSNRLFIPGLNVINIIEMQNGQLSRFRPCSPFRPTNTAVLLHTSCSFIDNRFFRFLRGTMWLFLWYFLAWDLRRVVVVNRRRIHMCMTILFGGWRWLTLAVTWAATHFFCIRWNRGTADESLCVKKHI